MYLTEKVKFQKDILNMTNLVNSNGLLHICKNNGQNSNIQSDTKQLMKVFVHLVEDVVFFNTTIWNQCKGE